MSTEVSQTEFDQILADLNGLSKDRLTAIYKLAQIDIKSLRILAALEQIVLTDPSPEIQQAALGVINLPQNQRVYRAFSSINKKARTLLPAEIDRWVADRLISPKQAALLKGRLGSGKYTTHNN